MTKPSMHTSQAVVRVGDGRGFIVENKQTRLVITAADCLPIDDRGYLKLPPALPAMDLNEKTYPKLLGPLGAEPAVWCEYLFVNPVADIAVLSNPDDQELYDEARAYDELVDSVKPLAITDAPKMRGYKPGKAAAYLLLLDGEWRKCTVMRHGINLIIEDRELVAAGMSGSPIVSTKGKAIGLVSTSGISSVSTTGLFNPVLRDNLPAWFFREAEQ